MCTTEYIEKWSVVNRLIEIENEFQQYKPFHGFEHAMYRKICEAEIAIGKIQAADAVPVVRCRDCAVPHNKYTGCPELNGLVTPPDFYCPFGERKEEGARGVE